MTNEQILSEIQWRQKKIDDLTDIYNMPVSSVNIWFHNGNEFSLLTQHTFPFSLANELKMLILESIIYYENEIQTLKNQL